MLRWSICSCTFPNQFHYAVDTFELYCQFPEISKWNKFISWFVNSFDQWTINLGSWIPRLPYNTLYYCLYRCLKCRNMVWFAAWISSWRRTGTQRIANLQYNWLMYWKSEAYLTKIRKIAAKCFKLIEIPVDISLLTISDCFCILKVDDQVKRSTCPLP